MDKSSQNNSRSVVIKSTSGLYYVTIAASLLALTTGAVSLVMGFAYFRPLLVAASLLLPCGVAIGIAMACKMGKTRNRVRDELRHHLVISSPLLASRSKQQQVMI